MPTLVDIQGYFASWYSNFIGLFEFLTADSVGDRIIELTEYINSGTDGSIIASALLNGIGTIINLFFGDASLLGILLGGTVGFYIVYQLIVWFLNIIT